MELNKRQVKTLKSIGRWSRGSYTHCKAVVTSKQLESMGLVEFVDSATCLTTLGKETLERMYDQ